MTLGYLSIQGLEYPAVVEFAPFQKIAKKKLKKKDTKTGSIEDDPEYKQFLESYSLEEEKTSASPETLLGEIEAKTRELLARRTTPLLEYIKNRKLEKQRLREEKREERRRRELEKKRLREEEKRKRREEDRCKRKEAEKQKRVEKDVRIKLLKKLETGEEATTEKPKERGEAVGAGDEKQDTRPVESQPETPGERLQDGSDKEQRDKRFREKDPETSRCHADSCRKHGIHSEFARFSRRNEDESKWGKGFTQDRGKKGQDGSVPMDVAERSGMEHKEYDSLPRKDRPGNKAL